MPNTSVKNPLEEIDQVMTLLEESEALTKNPSAKEHLAYAIGHIKEAWALESGQAGRNPKTLQEQIARTQKFVSSITKHNNSQPLVIARWESKTKRDFVEVTFNGIAETSFEHAGPPIRNYSYRGNGCGGAFTATSDEHAINKMEAPWEDPHRAGIVTVLKTDIKSLKRVF